LLARPGVFYGADRRVTPPATNTHPHYRRMIARLHADFPSLTVKPLSVLPAAKRLSVRQRNKHALFVIKQCSQHSPEFNAKQANLNAASRPKEE